MLPTPTMAVRTGEFWGIREAPNHGNLLLMDDYCGILWGRTAVRPYSSNLRNFKDATDSCSRRATLRPRFDGRLTLQHDVVTGLRLNCIESKHYLCVVLCSDPDRHAGWARNRI